MRTLLGYLASCVLMVVLATPIPVSAAENVVPVVFEDYPPYEFVEDGEVRGVNIDLIREAFKRMGVKPFFEPRPWKRALYDIEHGDIIALSSGFKTDRREKYAIFPSEHLAMETNVVVALAMSDVEVDSLEDLRGLNVGVVREYVYGHGFEEMRGFNKVETNSSHQLLKMLLEQRMDVAVGNKAVFKHLAKKYGKLSRIRFVYEIGSDPLYLFFSRARAPMTEKLSRDFGRTIRGMHEDGTFATIEAKY